MTPAVRAAGGIDDMKMHGVRHDPDESARNLSCLEKLLSRARHAGIVIFDEKDRVFRALLGDHGGEGFQPAAELLPDPRAPGDESGRPRAGDLQGQRPVAFLDADLKMAGRRNRPRP